ncbi:PAS domain S-box protein, partial [Streptomyces sp. NPDC056290]|uniref:PAS domain S-box protein n=1 Tax=Streptomyces sp. NPDC056290 TaxID=3345771 RepID=UPI0035DCCF84
MSEIPAKATESEDSSGGARSGATGGPFSGDAPSGDGMWQSSPPGSMYDYIKVASFSIGPDGLVDQWSLRAEQIFGIPAERAVGMDPIEAFIEPVRRERGQRKMAEILDGREWTGVVPFRLPDSLVADERDREGLAEVYVMPTRTEEGERAAVCIVVDVRT